MSHLVHRWKLSYVTFKPRFIADLLGLIRQLLVLLGIICRQNRHDGPRIWNRCAHVQTKHLHKNLPNIIYRYTYVQLYIIASTLSKYPYTFQKSTDIAFQEHATLPQFHGGQTSGLQRTAVTRVRLLDYENYRTPLGKNPWDFCRFSHQNQSTMNKEPLMIDGETSLNPI